MDPKPDWDAAGQQTLDGASVEGVDGMGEGDSPLLAQEVQALIWLFRQERSVEGPGYWWFAPRGVIDEEWFHLIPVAHFILHQASICLLLLNR